jgi:hypothetical protein
MTNSSDFDFTQPCRNMQPVLEKVFRKICSAVANNVELAKNSTIRGGMCRGQSRADRENRPPVHYDRIDGYPSKDKDESETNDCFTGQ